METLLCILIANICLNPLIFWLIVILVTAVIEGMTVSLTSIWFTFGALCAAIAYLCACSFTAQIVVFLVVSLLSLILSFKFRPIRNFLSHQVISTNYEASVGQTALVIKEVSSQPGAVVGQIKIKQQVWSAVARSKAGQIQCFAPGTLVKVVAIKGVHAIVDTLDDK